MGKIEKMTDLEEKIAKIANKAKEEVEKLLNQRDKLEEKKDGKVSYNKGKDAKEAIDAIDQRLEEISSRATAEISRLLQRGNVTEDEQNEIEKYFTEQKVYEDNKIQNNEKDNEARETLKKALEEEKEYKRLLNKKKNNQAMNKKINIDGKELNLKDAKKELESKKKNKSELELQNSKLRGRNKLIGDKIADLQKDIKDITETIDKISKKKGNDENILKAEDAKEIGRLGKELCALLKNEKGLEKQFNDNLIKINANTSKIEAINAIGDINAIEIEIEDAINAQKDAKEHGELTPEEEKKLAKLEKNRYGRDAIIGMLNVETEEKIDQHIQQLENSIEDAKRDIKTSQNAIDKLNSTLVLLEQSKDSQSENEEKKESDNGTEKKGERQQEGKTMGGTRTSSNLPMKANSNGIFAKIGQWIKSRTTLEGKTTREIIKQQKIDYAREMAAQDMGILPEGVTDKQIKQYIRTHRADINNLVNEGTIVDVTNEQILSKEEEKKESKWLSEQKVSQEARKAAKEARKAAKEAAKEAEGHEEP